MIFNSGPCLTFNEQVRDCYNRCGCVSSVWLTCDCKYNRVAACSRELRVSQTSGVKSQTAFRVYGNSRNCSNVHVEVTSYSVGCYIHPEFCAETERVIVYNVDVNIAESLVAHYVVKRSCVKLYRVCMRHNNRVLRMCNCYGGCAAG